MMNMRNTPNPPSTPTAESPTWSESGEIRGSAQTSKALSLLRMAALSLPGLAMNAAMADEGYAVTAAPGNAVIQGGANYTPTGASRLLGQLANEPTSSKQYRVNCFDDGSGEPTRLRLRIQGMTKANFLVSATIERNGESQTVIDPTNGDSRYAEYAVVTQGGGDYTLTVNKVKKKDSAPDSSLDGAMTFQTMQECNTATGAYTGITKPTLIGGDTPVDPTNPPGTVSSSKLKDYSSSLGKPLDSKSIFVSCTANKAGQNTARYKFQIKAATKKRPFTLRMTVKKDGQEMSVLDPISGDNAFSELMAFDGGNGRYEVIVSKESESGDTAKSMSFEIKHVCETETMTQGKLSVSKK